LSLDPLEARQLLTVSPQLLGDLNANPNLGSSDPRNIVQVGNVAYFTAHTDLTGAGLWKTNGTAAGTALVSLEQAKNLFNFNGTLFFAGTDNAGDTELWKSDGTTAGTVRVLDLNPGTISSTPREFTVFQNTLYFIADSNHAGGLWKTDGTAAGTQLVQGNFTSQYGYPGPTELTTAGGKLFFVGESASTHQEELWVSDGTTAGSSVVKNLNGNLSSHPIDLTPVGTTLFFSALDVGGEELWQTDGTAAGTVMVQDINPGSPASSPREMVNVGGTLFFSAVQAGFGRELFMSTGAGGTTQLVKDIFGGTSSSSPTYLTNVNGKLFFSALNAVAGRELWSSGGTAATTTRVADIVPGGLGSLPRGLINLGGTLFFAADSAVGTELWKSDGTTAGTVLVKDIFAGGDSGLDITSYSPSTLTNFQGSLLFAAQNGAGFELWKSQGDANTTNLVKDLNGGTLSSTAADLTNVSGTLYFTANYVPTPGNTFPQGELWKSNGLGGGTVKVADISSYKAYRRFGYDYAGNSLANVNGVLYFANGDATHGFELWKADASGIALVKDIFPGAASSIPQYLTNVNGTLFFSARGTSNNTELWKSDGTSAGTVIVKDLGEANPSYGYYGSYPKGLANHNGKLYFSSEGANYVSDGTAAGTVQTPLPQALTAVGSTLYYATGTSIFKTDGLSAGTEVKFIDPNANPSDLINIAGTLYFTAFDAARGRELWKSDGTAAGTVPVKDIAAGAGSSTPTEFANVGGTLFFVAGDSTAGRELWKSDGTAAGTVRVRDIVAGASGSYPMRLTNVNGFLYFNAFDTAGGRELWTSDGTFAGTARLADLEPGFVGSDPWQLLAVGRNLFFSAATSALGRELYVVPPAANVAPTLDTAPNPTLATIVEDASNPQGTLVQNLVANSQTDPDAGAKKGIAVIAAGGLSVGTWQYSLNGGATWKALGVPADTAARLLPADSQTKVRFIPHANFNGQVKLFYRAWDQTQGTAGSLFDLTGNIGGSTAFSQAFETATLTITPVNDAPVLNTAATMLTPVAKNATNPPGTLVQTLVSGKISDVDANALQGIAITGQTGAANGTWQFSTNGGTTWQNLGTPSESSARLLAADSLTKIRFVPNAGFTGQVTLRYRAWDRTQGAAGSTLSTSGLTGTTGPFSTASVTATLSVG
jgi:ELWxxDGT repeat protein